MKSLFCTIATVIFTGSINAQWNTIPIKMKTLIFCLLFLLSFLSAFAQWDSVGVYVQGSTILSENTGYYFTNETSGYHGIRSKLFKSADGFKTWQKIYEKAGDMGCCVIGTIFFCNDSVGFMSNYSAGYGGFSRTFNGGKSWSFVLDGAPPVRIFFLRPDYGYSIWPGYGSPGGKGAVHLIANGKDTIQYISTKYTFSDYWGEWIYFINDSTGFISCSDSLNKKVILRTADYGISWEPLPDSLGTNKIIQFPSNSKGYILNSDGDLYASMNLGATWQFIGHLSNETLNSMSFVNDEKGYIVGNNGLILKTFDGGIHWDTEIFKPESDLVKIQFVNDSVGFLVAKTVYFNQTFYFLYKTASNVSVPEHNEKPPVVRLHPNPAHSQIFLELSPGIKLPSCLEIISMEGITLIRLDEFQSVIDVSALSPGLYGLKYTIGELVGVVRFVMVDN